MTSSTFGNLLNGSGLKPLNLSAFYKPMNTALTSKINPSPLTPAKTAPTLNLDQAFSSGGLKVDNPAPAKTVAPTTTPATTSTPTGLTGDHLAGLIKTVSDLQKNVSDFQKSQTKVPETPKAPETENSNFSSLVQLGTDKARQAALLGKKKELAESDVMGNPSYSLDTQVGRAGLIDKNIGAQETGLAKESEAAFQGANAIKPEVTAFGQTVFNPQTGEFKGGDASQDKLISPYVDLMGTGQSSAIPSSITSNPVLQARLLEMVKAKYPNFNVNQAAGTQAGQQAIASNVVGMQSANTAAKGIQNTIKSFLDSNPDLNPSALAASNVVQQWLQGKQLADPKYQTLFNYLNEYVSTLAPVLGVGGDPTNLKTEIAQSFINAQASGQSIGQVLDATAKLADDKVRNIQSGGFGGGQVAGPGAEVQAGGYGFTKDANGKWVVKK